MLPTVTVAQMAAIEERAIEQPNCRRSLLFVWRLQPPQRPIFQACVLLLPLQTKNYQLVF